MGYAFIGLVCLVLALSMREDNEVKDLTKYFKDKDEHNRK